MRWGRARAELILRLRSILLNRQWEAFCSYLAKFRLTLSAQPQPAHPHDAVPRMAA